MLKVTKRDYSFGIRAETTTLRFCRNTSYNNPFLTLIFARLFIRLIRINVEWFQFHWAHA